MRDCSECRSSNTPRLLRLLFLHPGCSYALPTTRLHRLLILSRLSRLHRHPAGLQVHLRPAGGSGPVQRALDAVRQLLPAVLRAMPRWALRLGVALCRVCLHSLLPCAGGGAYVMDQRGAA